MITSLVSRKKHGTDMCIYVLKELVSRYCDLNANIFLCFFDASKAFDRVHHDKLFSKLAERNVPGYLVRILRYLYKHRTMSVRWGGGVSPQNHSM